MSKTRSTMRLMADQKLSAKVYSDLLWQDLTRTANAGYDDGDDHGALQGYNAALEEAERLLSVAGGIDTPCNAAVLLVISHHNLAELALANGQAKLALHHYQTPFDRLVSLARLPCTPAALRQSCGASLKEATIILAAHLQTYGAPASIIADTINRAKFVATALSAPAPRASS